MIAVLDASAAVATSLALPSAKAITEKLREAELVLAPDLFVAECCNAFWKYRKANVLSGDDCENGLERALSLVDRLESSRNLHREAYALACRYAHPVYDTIYLTLARREVAVLFTLDRSLASLAGKLGIDTHQQSLAAFRQARAVEAVMTLQCRSAEQGTDTITMDEINAEIKAVRKKRVR